jgi:hypothetical protein
MGADLDAKHELRLGHAVERTEMGVTGAQTRASKRPTCWYMARTESGERMSTCTVPDRRPATTTSCRSDSAFTAALPIVPAPPTR